MEELSIILTGYDLTAPNSGIGANAWGLWRILIPYQSRFRDAGLLHDVLYENGGSETDKRLADNIFHDMCLRNCNSNLQKSFSDLYYFCLKCYGYKFFNYR